MPGKRTGWLENEPDTIPDPDAEMPEEWDEEEDGTWVPPSVPCVSIYLNQSHADPW